MSVGWTLIVAGVVTSAALTGAARYLARRWAWLDIPNRRSSHTAAMPKGAGPVIVGVFLVLLVLAAALQGLTGAITWVLIFGGLPVALVGLWADCGRAPITWRLVVHAGAALMAVLILGGLPALPMGGEVLVFGKIGYLVAALAVVWLVNLYNFMDGIDGIAGLELVTVAAGAALLLASHGQAQAVTVLLVFGACGLGFLAWNWPPARIFMGDAGSGFIGFAFAAFVLWTGDSQGIGLWAWGILLGVFLVDATWTLLRRALSGQRFYEPHRSHAYQYAARYFGAHWKVTAAVGGINVVWLLPLAALASWWPEWGGGFLLIAWLPLLWLCWWFGAGKAERGV